MKFNDPIASQFVEVYGIKNLLEDAGLEKIMTVGQHLMALCPFHDNKKEPDFGMEKKTGLWQCFGCGETGNIYQFVSRIYNLDFKAASGFIEKLAGFDSNTNIEDIKFKSHLRNILSPEKTEEIAIPIPEITSKIMAQMNTGPDPYNYLLNRGLSQKTIDYFECTFTNGWRAWNKDKEEYKYEERIVIPLHNENGKLCGFVGRTPVGDEPKYRYTKGFPKSRLIFNYHRARHHTSENGLIIVEGSVDTMQLHEIGFPNTGCIYGASPSAEQIDLIIRITDKVFIATDNDDAGRIAAKKLFEPLKDVIDTNIVNLQMFKDPGEIKENKIFKNMLDTSTNWGRFKIKSKIRW